MARSLAINEQKRTMVFEKHYDEVLICNNGLFNVRKCRRWGYVDQNGKEITPIKYDGPETKFVDGKAQVKFNRAYFTVDEITGTEHEI